MTEANRTNGVFTLRWKNKGQQQCNGYLLLQNYVVLNGATLAKLLTLLALDTYI